PRPAFAKPDRRIAVAPAMGAEDRLVAVLEKAACLAAAQGQGAGAVLALLAEAAPALLGLARDRAAAKQVTGDQIASAAGVVGAQLRQRPVQVCRVAVRDAVGRQTLLAHPRREDEGLERNIDGAMLLVVLVEEIGQGARIAGGARRLRDPERLQRLGRDDPR